MRFQPAVLTVVCLGLSMAACTRPHPTRAKGDTDRADDTAPGGDGGADDTTSTGESGADDTASTGESGADDTASSGESGDDTATEMACDTGDTACTTLVRAGSGSIQDAIDAAAAGDTICVCPGDYGEELDFGSANLAVVGLGGPEATSVTRVVFDASDDATPRFEGFTVKGGTGKFGGCISVDDNAPTLKNLIVEDCEARIGAGIYASESDPTLTNVIVRDNTTILSGSAEEYVWGGGIAMDSSGGTLDNVLVEDNVSAYNAGGGIYLFQSAVTIQHSLVRGNTAERDGGYLCRGDEEDGGGGGIIVYEGAVELNDVIVTDNQALNYDGGGVYAWNAKVTMLNSVIADNSAAGCGGGLAVLEGWNTFINTVVSDNTSEMDEGGGIAELSETTASTFSNTDAWGNAPDEYTNIADASIAYSGLSVDPVFLDETWHLDAASPLIDAGYPSLRDPDGSRSDIGAWGGADAGGWDLDADGFFSWWRPGAYDAMTSSGLDCDDEDASVYPAHGC